MVVDFGVTWLLKEIVHVNKYVANSCGFIAAATSNYWLNRLWTFQSANTNIGVEYFSFTGIAAIGLGINNTVIYLLVNRLKMNFYLSKVFAIMVVTIWNFLANYYFTFK